MLKAKSKPYRVQRLHPTSTKDIVNDPVLMSSIRKGLKNIGAYGRPDHMAGLKKKKRS